MLAPKVGLALALVQILFGVHYFVAKLILADMPPRAWAAVRICIAAAILLVWTVLAKRARPHGRDAWKKLALYALFGVTINQLLFVEGLSRTTPSHSALINSLIPVLTLALAIAAGKERATPLGMLSIVVSFASVLLLLGVERFRLQDDLVLGDLLTLANGLSFSTFLVLSRDYLRRHDPVASTAWILGIGALGILAIGAGPLGRDEWGALPPRFWGLAAFAIVGATVVTYFLNSYALRHTDSSMVALFIYLQPPIATALSVGFLHERPTPRFYAASAGVLLGLLLAVQDRSRIGARPRRRAAD
jgi:drug/metabolite transporter (DMT)-like permease